MKMRLTFVAIILLIASLYAAALWALYGQAPPQTIDMVRGAR